MNAMTRACSVALGAAALSAAAQDPAPRLLQPVPALRATAAPTLPTVRTPTLVFKAAAWPLSITTGALVHGTKGWPALTTPVLAFNARAWPAAVTTAPLVLRASTARTLQTLQPAANAASIPSLLNRSR